MAVSLVQTGSSGRPLSSNRQEDANENREKFNEYKPGFPLVNLERNLSPLYEAINSSGWIRSESIFLLTESKQDKQEIPALLSSSTGLCRG